MKKKFKTTMNKREIQNAALLKKYGFTIISQDRKNNDTEFWAIHHKLLMQYDVLTAAEQAILDLNKTQSIQLVLGL
jgi:hypothetical protein